MASGNTIVARDGAVLIFTFNRPDKFNSLTGAMLSELAASLASFAEDTELRVLLIRAEGKYFSAGMDVNEIASADLGEGPSNYRRVYRGVACHDLWDALEAVEKPVVVAHQGACMGAGLEMSLSCDFRLASDAAKYSLPELNMGMIPGSGGTSRLVRIAGGALSRARRRCTVARATPSAAQAAAAVMPLPAVSTWPRITSSTSLPARPVCSSRRRITAAPSCGAGMAASEP